MIISLHDTEPDVVSAWMQRLARYENVVVTHGDIIASRCDALVSPANSEGFMDGGVDLAYLRFFGLQIQNRVQSAIAARYAGSMPIGEAMIVKTGHPRMSRLVVAPTMEFPRDISETDNVYRATVAVLRCVADAKPSIERLAIPGMGTGIGRMDPDRSAEQMERAIVEVLAPKKLF